MSTQHTPKTKLVSVNLGNLHEIASYANKFGLSDFLLCAQSSGGSGQAIFRLPIDWPTDNFGPLAATPGEHA